MTPFQHFFKNFDLSQQLRLFLWIFLAVLGMICLPSLSLADEKGLYDARGKRDPFIPLVTLTMKSSSSNLLGVDNIEDLVVEGVVYDPVHGSLVIVNGAVLKEGEELGSVKVVKVEVNGAHFLINGAEGFKEIYQEDSSNKGKNAKEVQ